MNSAKEYRHITGSRISVLGAGRSGIAAAKLLLKHGATVFLSDNASTQELEKNCGEINQPGFDFELGKHSDRILESTDLIVISPGIPLDVPIIIKAAGKKIPVFGELEMTSWLCKNRIIAVTGTNGKSTAVSMIGSVFDSAERPARVAGNIGVAFADVVDDLAEDETVILEVSSYQLETIDTFHPWISALLNVKPDHLKRHKTIEEYMRCKLRICENQTAKDLAIINKGDAALAKVELPGEPKKWWISNQESVFSGAGVNKETICYYKDGNEYALMPCREMPVPGTHNVENALVAVCTARYAGISTKNIANGLRSYKGLEHRLEYTGELSGVRFINDSKATNIDSLLVAIKSFRDRIVLIAGGEDKGTDLSAANNMIKDRVKALLLIGESSDRMFHEWKNIIPDIGKVTDLESAVNAAYGKSEPGDIILLSPACASFDMFKNFEERGNIFKKIVSDLILSKSKLN